MSNFILNVILWTLAIYGLMELIREIISTRKYTNEETEGIYLIIAVKNKEDKIEGIMRSMVSKFVYGKGENFKQIIVTDLGSSDNTLKILNVLKKEYECIRVSNWKDCNGIFDEINNEL